VALAIGSSYLASGSSDFEWRLGNEDHVFKMPGLVTRFVRLFSPQKEDISAPAERIYFSKTARRERMDMILDKSEISCRREIWSGSIRGKK
jgi:hypothetical protein